MIINISEHVNLLELMDYLGNVNHDISVVRYWIFDTNYEKVLVLNRESFDMICAPSIDEKKWLRLKEFLCEKHSLNSALIAFT